VIMRSISVLFSVLASIIAQDVPNMRHVHPSLVTSCVTEQLRSGLGNVKNCLKCFEAVGDPLSQEGLDKAKVCTDTWLPRAQVECQEELDAMAPGDIESSEIVLACFTDVRFLIGAEECLEEQRVDDVIETLTDGVLCLQERQTNLTNIIQYIFREEIKDEFENVQKLIKENREEKIVEESQEKLDEQGFSLVYQRHCNISSNSLEEETSCNQCFQKASHPSKLPSPQEYVTSLHSCTTKFLSPLYDSCSNLLDELAHNETHDGVIGRELFLCFTRVVDRHQVGTCALDVSAEDLDAWTLLDVMVCNDDINDSWVMNHVDPKNLEQIQNAGAEIEDIVTTTFSTLEEV